jgi:transposase
MRYELSDHEWEAIKPMLPNKPRGGLHRGQPTAECQNAVGTLTYDP